MTLNLLDDLFARQVDQHELEQLLLSYFGNGAAADPGAIEYRHQGQVQPAVVLRYNNSGILTAIHQGSGLRESDVLSLQRTIRESLIDPTADKVSVRVLFSAPRVARWFRYKDVFQVLPAPPEAPSPEFLMGDHPVLLEVPFKDSPDSQIRILRRMRREREIELLCVALWSSIRGALGLNASHRWVLPEGRTPIGDWTSRYCQEAYVWPGQVAVRDSFSTVDSFLPAVRIPAHEYYARPGISIDKEFEVPDNIEESLDAFFLLPSEIQERFLRAAYWFQCAQRSFASSQSVAYTALVSAIEALVPPPVDGSHCATCRQRTGAGPTQRFADFIERYAPDPLVKPAERKQLYYLRSALAHGGKLLHRDRVAWGAFASAGLRDMQDLTTMWRLVRIAFVNWLRAPASFQ